jgi:hypothetical protein
MRKIVLFALFMSVYTLVNAQFKAVAEGPVFKEPEAGYAKILQMKNGNTMFIVITPKKGVDVQLYGPDHQQLAVTNFETSFGKLGHGEVEAAFEINDDAVLMVAESESRVPTLFRIIIDGKTGNLKDDQKIAELNKLSFGAGYAMAFGGVPVPDFFIRKDPESDNYAIAMFNTFESDRSKRIEIVTYGSDNKEVSRAYYNSPDEKYKYMQYVDMAVIGNDKVCVLAYAYNTAHSGGKESELVLANLNKGAKAVDLTELDFSKDLQINYGITRYSPATKSLILVALAKSEEERNSYIPILAIVNPYSKKIERANPISPSDKANQYSKKGFTGLPQDLFINADGTFSVVSEQILISTYTSSMGGSSTSSILSDMVVVNYSKTGEPVNEYFMRKSHSVSNMALHPFYLSRREGTAQQLIGGNQFKSFAYLNGANKSYILFNDTERNNEKQESGSLVTVSGVSGSDGFYYPLTGTDEVPKRDYVFGNPAGRRDHILGLFSISDYDRKNNIYVTLKLSNDSGKKGVQIVWLQPQ